MSLTVKPVLSIPPTAIENERVSSISGILSLARRSRASAELLDMASSIYYNYNSNVRAALEQLPR